jgi:tight adherence protein B
MRRLVFTLALALSAAAAAVSTGAAAGPSLQLTPVGRLPFPDRGYVVDLPSGVVAEPSAVKVRENGRLVRDLQVSPLEASGIHFGVVVAVDASDSMRGAPLRAAVGAARAFLANRRRDEEVGVVAFNGNVYALQPPTSNSAQLARALSRVPQVAYGTRIYDAIGRSLTMLDRAKLSTGSIVLLSDGTDLGSRAQAADVLKRARALHVRIFTVGLRSPDFDASSLQTLARGSGGSYVEAPTASRLESIYAALGRRLSSEYLVRYRSDVPPHSLARVTVQIRGVGHGATHYTAPTPAGLAPFHRSFFSRLVLSPVATVLLGLLVAGLAALTILAFLQPRRSTVVERVAEFAAGGRKAEKAEKRRIPRRLGALPAEQTGRLARLEQKLEIARIETSAQRVVLLTLLGTVAAVIVLALISPIFALLGLLTPLVTRSFIAMKLRNVREDFADQLPPNLQVLASALRVGHSFVGALSVVVDNAHEPSQSELQRVLADEQLGVPLEEAVRRVAVRMASRDLEQVALLAELQRTAGGNSAEVLDTVVETLRGRADLRRLLRTLTAQGRMARWILTGLPVVAGLAMWLLQGPLMRPLFTTQVGQVLLALAAVMVVAGSLVIQKLVDIDV